MTDATVSEKFLDPLAEAELAADVAALGQIEAIPTLLEVVCRTTGMGFAAVTRVTDERWIACAVRDEISFGLRPGDELQLETTICNEIRASGELVVIDHVAEDSTYCQHHTPLTYGFQSYISVPIRLPGGEFFGTLCAIDPKPARVNTPATIGMFRMFAELIAFHINAQKRLAANESALRDANRTNELCEQFIAILGHDLRNPLASIDAGTMALSGMELPPSAAPVVLLMQRSAERMDGLIEDVLDFARGRLGGGLTVRREEPVHLEPVLAHVVAELRAAWTERVIRCDLQLTEPVSVDPSRISQLASNLLGNALVHGEAMNDVHFSAAIRDGVFELSVSNAGLPIPPHLVERLFHPFSRASAKRGQQGLGLGLYIASQIASAHGGTLSVQSDEHETRFTFRMPTVVAQPSAPASCPTSG